MSERRFIIETVYRAPQPMKKQAGMDEEAVIFTGRGMREILFRAKRKDNGEWVEGYFVNLWMKHHNRYDPLITTDECSHNIVPETVSEYTGLIDRNNKKIFEDDIIKDHQNGEVGRVIFYNGSWMVWGYDVERYEEFLSNLCSVNYSKLFGRFVRGEVIGNIHDNLELLKGETK